MVKTAIEYPVGFTDFLNFVCKKYDVDPKRVFIKYDSNSPPRLKGNIPGYYDGLLSYREIGGNREFLITVFRIARDPLLTLGHEFAHLVDDLKRGTTGGPLRPPDEARERDFDARAILDLEEFRSKRKWRATA
ncbi:MAG TPA: hypothetical protein VE177_00540 [Candidatus Binatus sp.]|nr:hypothetical protein [Candidatus Binatus sp.]